MASSPLFPFVLCTLILCIFNFRGAVSQQPCIVRFEISQSKSTFNLSGTVTKPLKAPITGNPVSFTGALYLSLTPPPGGTCPSSNATGVSLAGASLVAPAPAYPLPAIASPANITAKVGASGTSALATATIMDLGVSVTAGPLPAPTATFPNGAQTVATALTWTIVQGLASIVSILSADPSYSDMSGANSTSNLASGVYIPDGVTQTASLDFPNITLSFALDGEEAATLVFTGRLFAEAVFGCPASCSLRGACTAATAASATGPTCACDCGYGGSSCSNVTIPALSVASAAVLPPGSYGVVVTGDGLGDAVVQSVANSATPPVTVTVGGAPCTSVTSTNASSLSCVAPTAPQGSQLAVVVARGCRTTPRSEEGLVTLGPSAAPTLAPPTVAPQTVPPAGGGLNPAGCKSGLSPECSALAADRANVTGACSCACQSGWYGQECNVCTSSQACQSLGLGSRCETSLLYSSNTTAKHYDCALTSDGLSGIVKDTVTLDCDVTSKNCTVWLQADDFQGTPVVCTATQCAFTPGLASIKCPKSTCGCGSTTAPCTSSVSAYTSQVSGAATFTCSGTACTLDITGFPVTMDLACQAGECTDSGPALGLQPTHTNWAVLGSSIGVVVAALTAASVAWWLARNHYCAAKERQFLAWVAWKNHQLSPAASSDGANGVNAEGLDKSVATPGAVAGGMGAVAGDAEGEGEDRGAAVAAVGVAALSEDGAVATAEDAKGNGPGGAAGVDASMRSTQGAWAKGVVSGVAGSSMAVGVIAAGAGKVVRINPMEAPGRTYEVEDLTVMTTVQGAGALDKLGIKLLGSHRFETLRQFVTGTDRRAYRHEIVSSVNLKLMRGSMLAILGPTGSGKTTLLNVLAGVGGGRTIGTSVYGKVTVDGLRRDESFRRLAAYLPQEDYLYSTLTILECVRYSAYLRLPAHMPRADKDERVDDIIEYLGLNRVKNNRVGSTFGGPGLSGGERRRVRIAMELVSSPRIVLLDEPTSGLDSHTAARLVSLLHGIARRGAIVILSVHQPGQETFNAFDQVLLLSKQGRIAYFGPRASIGAHFDRLGYPCPAGRNFADHMLEVVSEAKELEHVRHSTGGSVEERDAVSRTTWETGTVREGKAGGETGTVREEAGAADGRGGAITDEGAAVSYGTKMREPCEDGGPRLSAGEWRGPAQKDGEKRGTDGNEVELVQLLEPAAEARSEVWVADGNGNSEEGPGKGSSDEVAAEEQKLVLPILESFKRATTALEAKQEAALHHGQPPPALPLSITVVGPDFHRSVVRELSVLYWREVTNIMRHPALLGLHLAMAIFMGLLVGWVFFQVNDEIDGFQNRAGAFYFSIALFAFSSLSALEPFISERIIFSQEGSAAYYRALSYFFPKVTLDVLVLRLLPAVTYTCIMYWMMGLNSEGAKFLIFLLTISLVSIITGFICSCISLLTNSVGVANIIAIVFMLVSIIFGGYILNPQNIPTAAAWLTKLSFVYYSWEVLMINEIQDFTVMFQPSGFAQAVPVKGEVFLETLGVRVEHKSRDLWLLLVMATIFLILALCLLAWRVRQGTRLKSRPPLTSAQDIIINMTADKVEDETK